MKSVVVGFRLKQDVYQQLAAAAASASLALSDLCRMAVDLQINGPRWGSHQGPRSERTQ